MSNLFAHKSPAVVRCYGVGMRGDRAPSPVSDRLADFCWPAGRLVLARTHLPHLRDLSLPENKPLPPSVRRSSACIKSSSTGGLSLRAPIRYVLVKLSLHHHLLNLQSWLISLQLAGFFTSMKHNQNTSSDLSKARSKTKSDLEVALLLATRDWKTRNWKTRHLIAGVEIARLENPAPNHMDGKRGTGKRGDLKVMESRRCRKCAT